MKVEAWYMRARAFEYQKIMKLKNFKIEIKNIKIRIIKIEIKKIKVENFEGKIFFKVDF